MPTSGLVISSREAGLIPDLLVRLSECDKITCGEPMGERLPIVVDTTNKADDQLVWKWLWNLPGVESVDVAFIYLEDNPQQLAVAATEGTTPCERDFRPVVISTGI